MRSANLIVVILGIAGVATAAAIAWRWRGLPLLADLLPAVETRRAAAIDGLHTLAVAMTAGLIAGLLVPGLGGRLVMRILGATSSDAQGVRTDADQLVGEITFSGTSGVLIFVGVLGGVIAALAFLVVRRWLPTTAGPAGVVGGVLLLGTIGVSDAMSPDNTDFAVLGPTWLALSLVVALALLFGVTFTALAARLDAGIPSLRARPSGIASHAALIIFFGTPVFLAGAVVYINARAISRGRLRPLLASPPSLRIGHAILAIATIFATVSSIQAVREIVSA